jgi:hypothetical protein
MADTASDLEIMECAACGFSAVYPAAPGLETPSEPVRCDECGKMTATVRRVPKERTDTARRVKVYGTNDWIPEQRRIFAAAKSRAEFSRMTGLSQHYLKDYSCETGNALECAVALRDVGKIFAWKKNQEYRKSVTGIEDVTAFYRKRLEVPDGD